MRRTGGIIVLSVVLVVVMICSIGIGSLTISIPDVWDALWNKNSTEVGSQIVTIIHDHRIPRALVGLTAGLAIGAAGALAQGHTRNPLADPGMLGVNAGAALAVVISVYVFSNAAIAASLNSSFAGDALGLIGLDFTPALVMMLFGLVGAMIASLLVFGLAAMSGTSPITLVLAGVGLSAMLTAVTSAIVLSDSVSLDLWRVWSVGSVSGRGIELFWAGLPFIAIGMVLALASGFFLNVLSLGDDMTKALGSRVAWIRISGILGITLLVGAATAACGPIAFLGLVVPHIARAWVGADYRWIIPYSALLGALLLIVCDVIGRVISRPEEIQVGVVLAMIGAPFLIAMVRRTRLASV